MQTVAPIGDPMAVVAYSHRFATQAIHKTTAAMLMSASLNPREQCNFVQWFEELGKGPGGTVRWALGQTVNGPGVLGLAEVTGQEVPLTWIEDEMVINRDRMPVIFDSFSQQMVPFSLRDMTKTQLGNWLKQNLAYGVGNQLGGNTAQANIAYTGMNAPIAPDANHWIFGGNAANEAALISNVFKMTIDKLDQIQAMAQTGLANPIKPVSIKGIEVLGVLFLNGFQIRDLQADFGQHSWGQIQLAAMQGGQVTGNPIFTSALGFYKNIAIHMDNYFPWGDNTQNTIVDSRTRATIPAPNSLGAVAAGTTSVARGVLVGAQAGMFANGGSPGPTDQPLRAQWVEELVDANAKLRITAGMTWGFKKTRFRNLLDVNDIGEDFATITLSTYASPSGA